MSSSVFIKGVWYEVEVTECYTYMILRDKFGNEFKFYNDTEGMSEMLKIYAMKSEQDERSRVSKEILARSERLHFPSSTADK